MSTVIEAVSTYSPRFKLTNSILEEILKNQGSETSDEWIVQRTGIKQRHIAAENETNATMAVRAVQKALRKLERVKQYDRKPIEYIIFATNTNVTDVPCRAVSEIQKSLRKSNPESFDVNASGCDVVGGCAGINVALKHADALIKSGIHERIAVVAADHLSSVTDYSNRSMAVLFGDGASAYILGERDLDGFGFLGHYEKGDGLGGGFISVGNKEKVEFYESLRAMEEARRPVKTFGRVMEMDGRNVYKFVVAELCNLLEGFKENKRLNPEGISIEDVSSIVLHQANSRMVESVMKDYPVLEGRYHTTIENFGNTSAASQGEPAKRSFRKAQGGDYVLMAGFGAGLIFAANLYRVPPVEYRTAA